MESNRIESKPITERGNGDPSRDRPSIERPERISIPFRLYLCTYKGRGEYQDGERPEGIGTETACEDSDGTGETIPEDSG